MWSSRGGRGLIILALCLASVIARAEERILNYAVELQVSPTGTLVVTERIRVLAEGVNIRRGIYRDFPTRYKDRLGNQYQVTFQLLHVARNGVAESHHIEKRSNGVRVYLGQSDRYLPVGEHEYLIRFQADRQLGFFEDYDELYWNVTGNNWDFPIEQASATVQLPGPVSEPLLNLAWYSGPQGSNDDQGAQARVINAQTVFFSTTRRLEAREGLTVAVGWPKGLVKEPSSAERLAWFFKDNSGALVLLLGFALTLTWYLVSWNRVGRDPRKGTIIPRYEPPTALSPAACRYVRDMSLRHQAVTAAVVSLGVKGHLSIEEDDEGFRLTGLDHKTAVAPSPGEQAVMSALLPSGHGTIELEHENHKAFRKARAGLSKALAREYKDRLFKLNGRYAVAPVLLSLAATVAAAMLGQSNPLIWVAWAVLMVVMHIGFIFLLRAPTPAGRLIMDEIEGFQLYLGTAEKDRLDRMHSPDLTPEVFESFLPYAFALGVENDWCERFAREFPQADDEAGAYQPAWYSGPFAGGATLGHISSGLASELSTAIVSASSPPGSSSGSGGGGFSGGGGGGGGGGGW